MRPSRWCQRSARSKETGCEKKPGSSEPGLRHWPCEADTITFQEGLLSLRATGGGGQMRDANTQRVHTMIRVRGLQQAVRPHVSHAETAGSSRCCHDGHRCALLTTKSRKTWTRAT